MPTGCTVGGFEDSCIFYARVNRIRIGERRLQMPHALELPRMRLAIVELVCGHGLARRVRSVIHELVAGRLLEGVRPRLDVAPRRFPRLAAVVGPLDHLPEP